jgi:hypothetical protein
LKSGIWRLPLERAWRYKKTMEQSQQQYQGPDRRQSQTQSQYQGEERRRAQPMANPGMSMQERKDAQAERMRQQEEKHHDRH